jgi:hypothetical protein
MYHWIVFHIVLPDRRPPAPKLKATVDVRGATCRDGPISDIVGRPQLIGDDRAFPIAQIRTLSSLDDLLSLPAAGMRPNGPPALLLQTRNGIEQFTGLWATVVALVDPMTKDEEKI